MNHRERMNALLRGAPTDRVPVALWRHFPNDDLHAATHAARAVEFQNQFDFDFVKVTPAAGYPAEMYGAQLASKNNREGTRAYLSRPVNAPADWDKIAPLDESNFVFQRETATLKLIRAQLGNDVHILQTIFSPLYSAGNLAGERMLNDLRAQPDALHRALNAITATTIQFARACLRAGADAIFFATQMASRQVVNETEFAEFGERYDRQVIEAVRGAKPAFILLHIHGFDIYFERLARWDVDILNWHDRRTAPSLRDAAEILRSAQNNKILLGGINEWDTLANETPQAIRAEARDAIAQIGGRGFVLGAGCVIPIDAPMENVQAARDAIAN
ncbi:MAG: uroporphyrinogen decarboxylase [Chloroflexi bacterium]|nr:uroporphyrinogen decarboxylase [Chloroflexota bacterium]